jgi:hypothetical protein
MIIKLTSLLMQKRKPLETDRLPYIVRNLQPKPVFIYKRKVWIVIDKAKLTMPSSSIKTMGVRHNPISIPVFFMYCTTPQIPLLWQVLVWQPSLVNESFITSISSHVCHEDIKSSLLKRRPIKAKIYNRHSLWLIRHCGFIGTEMWL